MTTWNGVEVAGARDVCDLLNRASTCYACRDGACGVVGHTGVNHNASDAPVWGDPPADIVIGGANGQPAGVPPTWSWDEAGCVVGVGGDGSEPFRFLSWAQVRDAQAD